MSSSVPVDQSNSQSVESHATAGRDRPAPKLKRCRICNREFSPRLTTQACCSANCAIVYSRGSEKRQSAAMKRVAIAEHKERVESLKTRRDWMREAQAAFNAWVRERDWNRPCISCGVLELDWTRGGSWDCGHYRSVGACPELRFEPLNAHKQCKKCNRYMSGNVVEFRFGLAARIGPENLEWLEGPHEAKKYTAEELREMTKNWRRETRAIRAKNVLGAA